MIKLHSLPENLHWLTGRDAPDQRKVCTLQTEYSVNRKNLYFQIYYGTINTVHKRMDFNRLSFTRKKRKINLSIIIYFDQRGRLSENSDNPI